MESPEIKSGSEKSELSVAISERAKTASAKVQEKVKNNILPNLEMMGSMGKRWLGGLQNDFYALAENVDDAVGAGAYEGWTQDDIKEYYEVLYGEKMDV